MNTRLIIFLINMTCTGISQISQGSSSTFENVFGANWWAQTFTVLGFDQITKVVLNLSEVNTPIGNLVVSIRATSGGLPTGADLGSVSTSAEGLPDHSSNSVGTDVDFTFATPIIVTDGAIYAIVIRATSADANNRPLWYKSTTSTYAGGSQVASTDSGANWTADTNEDFRFAVWGCTDVMPRSPGGGVAYSACMIY